MTDLEQQGIIQGFQLVYELACNVLRDSFIWQGNPTITGSRDAFPAAFVQGLIEDGEVWMEMIQSRNLTAHGYCEVIANAIAERVVNCHDALFHEFEARMVGAKTWQSA